MLALAGEKEMKPLMEAIPAETKIFLLVVTIAAVIIFILVVIIDNKSSCRCVDCDSIFPSSVSDYGKLSKKSKKKGRHKHHHAVTGPGSLSQPLGSSLSSGSSSEQDSDDDVIKNYHKSVVLSRKSLCQAMLTGSARIVLDQKEDGGQDGGDDDVELERRNEETAGTGSGSAMENRDGGKFFGIFKKKDKKVEKDGVCFKNRVFSPADEEPPALTSPAKIVGAKSFTDLSGSTSSNQSYQTASPLKSFWNKFNSRSPLKLPRDPISLNLTLTYFEVEGQLEVRVIEAKDVPSWAVVTRVKITLLPKKKEKFETKPKPGISPCYNEVTRFTIHPTEDVNHMTLRVRMYGGENRCTMLGWKLINFNRILRTKSTQFWICLENESKEEENLKSSSMQSIVSCNSDQGPVSASRPGNSPQLLLGLSYNDLTGFLKVRIFAAANVLMTEPPDPKQGIYVKLSVMGDKGQEMTHNRTTLKQGHKDQQSNISFHETFAFQIPLCQMEMMTLVVTVFMTIDKKKAMIGWCALGRNSSGEREIQHWNEIKNNKEVKLWHILLE